MKNKFKTVLFGVLFLGVTITANAQISTSTGGAANVLPNVPTTNTNVGIGTTNPTAKLEVVGSFKSKSAYFTGSSLSDGQTFIDNLDRTTKCQVFTGGSIVNAQGFRMINFYDFPVSNMNTKAMFWFSIDDRSDNQRFRVYAETGGNSRFQLNDKSQTEFMTVHEDGNGYVFMQFAKPNSRVVIGGFSDYPNSLGHKLFVQGGSAKIEGNILTDSNIGIGTTNFVDGTNTYRLSVKGKIRAEEIKVYNTWADYVFANNYDLKPLTIVEQYIKRNGHLPNVPSAKDISENGLELGEMAKIQQEKIEELTLYLIQQNAAIEELKLQVKALLQKKQ